MKKEEFNKLSQLDRVEYMLADQAIERGGFSFDNMVGLMWAFALLWIHLVTFGIVFYIGFDKLEVLTAIMGVFGAMFRPFMFLIVLIYAISLFIYLRKKKKLNQYFIRKKEGKKGK